LAPSVDTLKEPNIPSIKEKCSFCDTEVWIDKTMVWIAKKSNIICDNCFLKMNDSD